MLNYRPSALARRISPVPKQSQAHILLKKQANIPRAGPARWHSLARTFALRKERIDRAGTARASKLPTNLPLFQRQRFDGNKQTVCQASGFEHRAVRASPDLLDDLVQLAGVPGIDDGRKAAHSRTRHFACVLGLRQSSTVRAFRMWTSALECRALRQS